MNQLPGHDEWLVIVNPNAGKGKGQKDWHLIEGFIKKENIPFRVAFTKGKGEAIRISREAVLEGCRKIITVGGDGTLNEVVNGIFTNGACPPAEISLGLIPVGTGNDWGRMFGIPAD